MAAPTNVRVEATSISTTTLRWSYSGTNAIAVFRSTDGSSYAEVTNTAENPRVQVGTTSYTDSTLSAGTKYWYKLSDDGGSTFSSVVTVWTHGCITPATGGDGFSLPRMSHGGGDPVDEFNDAAQRIENVLQGRVLDPQDCAVCPEDGAIAIDCSDGCRSFVVIADQDINSISIQMCDEGEGNIDFIVPPNVTRRICGWPGGFGFTGDECTEAPIIGGATGRTMSVQMNGARANPAGTKSKAGYGGGAGRGGGAGGGAGCTCVPNGNGQLTIKSCNANNSLNCGSNKSLDLLVCGGKGPYTWSRTGTVNLKGVSGSTPGGSATGTKITVTPPTNSNPSEPGSAWRHDWLDCTFCTAGVCTTCGPPISEIHGCDDAVTVCTTTSSCGTPPNPPCASVPFESGKCDGFGNAGATTTFCGNTVKTKHTDTYCDVRTPTMIANGCNPCGVVAGGATVSVTDAAGVVATIILGP
jgi:hypothetical protein